MGVQQQLKSAIRLMFNSLLKRNASQGSEDYWIRRYKKGRFSGVGSYGKYARFKAEVINNFIKEHSVQSVIEFGCGDGNQLELGEYPRYLGMDVSPNAVALCQKRFRNDPEKKFKLVNEYNGENAELALSLDVIYHLVEQNVYHSYLERLFDSAKKYVVIYSTNYDSTPSEDVIHIRHRTFTQWVEEQRPEWKLLHYIKNKYPYNNQTQDGLLVDFYIFEYQPAK